jgi:release factor glutamine methyltransferase
MCKVLDLGTGSGAIVLALASERPDHVFYASDISPSALVVAKENARRLGYADRIHFFAGDWMAPLQPGGLHFDIIAANPPYIATSTLARLQPEIQRWEPRTALDGNEDGLKYLKHIVTSAPGFLLPGGYLALEIGHDQRKAVHEIVTACEYYDSLVFKQDYGRHDRVALLRKKRLAST